MQTLFQFHCAPGAAPAAVGGRPRGVDGGWRGEPEEERGASPLRDREGEERHRWRGAGAAGPRGVGGTRGRRSWWCERRARGCAHRGSERRGRGLGWRAASCSHCWRGAGAAGPRGVGGFRANTARPRSGFREHGKASGRVRQPRHARALPGGGGQALNLANVSPWRIQSLVARGAGWSVLGEVKTNLAEKENG